VAENSTSSTRPRARRSTSGRLGWWHNTSEKVLVAVSTAFVTGLLTLAGPPLNDWVFAKINDTDGVTPKEAAFQSERWARNSTCANSQPVWHETNLGHEIDATICPGTGDILLVLRDLSGRQIQWWSDNRSLADRFSNKAGLADAVLGVLAAPARAATASAEPARAPQLAQNVLCQMMFPDNRGLRRRLVVGPGQCVEIVIDTWTGTVVSQRRVPCEPNCAVNV